MLLQQQGNGMMISPSLFSPPSRLVEVKNCVLRANRGEAPAERSSATFSSISAKA